MQGIRHSRHNTYDEILADGLSNRPGPSVCYPRHAKVDNKMSHGRIESISQLQVVDLPLNTLSECNSVVEKLNTRDPTRSRKMGNYSVRIRVR